MTRPGTSMTRALSAEFLKLVTLPFTWLVTVGTVIMAVVVARAFRANAGLASDPDQLIRLVPGYAVVGIVIGGVMASTSEYTTRQISRSLTSVPSRAMLLTAKATTTAAWSFLAATLAMALARVAISTSGLEGSLGTILAAATHMTCMALIAAALGVLLRGLVASLAAALLLLVVAPPLVLTFTRAARWLPSVAGEQLFAEPARRVLGLALAAAVLTAWTAAAWGAAHARFASDA